MPGSPPNILFLITDQMTAGAPSCAGNPWLATPAHDRLAERGGRFARAYCAHPLCTPSRASMFTGRYPHQVNATANEGKFFWYHDIPREAFLGHPFAAAGYHCVYAGKDMPPADGSRDFELLCNWGDAQTADHLVEFLEGGHDRPFLAVGAFLNPHNICEWASGRSLPEPFPFDEPAPDELPPLPANFAVPPYEPEIVRAIQELGVRVYGPRTYTDEEWRRYLWAYHRMCELVDGHVGRVLDALDRTGLADDTLVVLTSDHGDGAAAHRWNQKQVLYEESVRVPLIVAGPGVPAGRLDAEHLVDTGLDLLPTFAAATGVAVAEDLPGASLLPWCRGDSGPGRDSVVVETVLNPERGDDPRRNRGRALIAADGWKYTVYEWGRHRETLVDLVADPGEMVDLSVCRAHRERLAAMRARLHEWTVAEGDSFRVPGHDAPTAEDRAR